MKEIENKFSSLDLHSENFESRILREGRVYLRNIEPLRGARKVEVSEVVETYMPDGTLESVSEANPGDWVIVGPEGEQFVFSNEKFNDLYVPGEDGTFLPKERKIIAIENPTNSKIRIRAPWGTEEEPAYQDGEKNCVLVIALNAEGEFTDDRYIIGNESILLSNYTLVN